MQTTFMLHNIFNGFLSVFKNERTVTKLIWMTIVSVQCLEAGWYYLRNGCVKTPGIEWFYSSLLPNAGRDKNLIAPLIMPANFWHILKFGQTKEKICPIWKWSFQSGGAGFSFPHFGNKIPPFLGKCRLLLWCSRQTTIEGSIEAGDKWPMERRGQGLTPVNARLWLADSTMVHCGTRNKHGRGRGGG